MYHYHPHVHDVFGISTSPRRRDRCSSGAYSSCRHPHVGPTCGCRHERYAHSISCLTTTRLCSDGLGCLVVFDGLGCLEIFWVFDGLEIFWFFDGLEKPFFSGPCVYHVGVYTPKCLGNSDGLEIFWAFFYRLHMGSMECLVSIYFISILFLFFSYRLLYSIKLKVYILYIPYTKVEMAPQTPEKHMKKQGSELPPQKNHEQGIHSTIHGYTLPRHSTTRQRPLIGRDD